MQVCTDLHQDWSGFLPWRARRAEPGTTSKAGYAWLGTGCGIWDSDSLPRIKIPHILCLKMDNTTPRKADTSMQTAFHKAVWKASTRPRCCLNTSQHKGLKAAKSCVALRQSSQWVSSLVDKSVSFKTPLVPRLSFLQGTNVKYGCFFFSFWPACLQQSKGFLCLYLSLCQMMCEMGQ